MLCTRMRLAERRYSMSRYSNGTTPTIGGTHHGNHQPPVSTGIVQRPCVIRNLTNYSTDSTPRITRQSCQNDKSKPSLVVFSLKMQPGTKTLAQEDVKRDPRKLPAFCEHYKNVKKIRPTDDIQLPELIVRGVVLSDDHNHQSQSNGVYKKLKATNSGEGEDDEFDFDQMESMNDLKIELTDCCHCMRDDNTGDHATPIVQMINDNCGKYLTVGQSDGRIFGGGIYRPYSAHGGNNFGGRTSPKRDPSPRTRQVIRITVNNKKSE